MRIPTRVPSRWGESISLAPFRYGDWPVRGSFARPAPIDHNVSPDRDSPLSDIATRSWSAPARSQSQQIKFNAMAAASRSPGMDRQAVGPQRRQAYIEQVVESAARGDGGASDTHGRPRQA